MADWLLTRGRVPFLLGLVLFTAIMAFSAAGVRIERDNQSLNARDPEQQRVYERFQERFGGSEDVLLALSAGDLLQPSGLRRLDRLTRRIAEMEGVRRVYSLTTLPRLVRGDVGVETAPLVSPPFDSADAAALRALGSDGDSPAGFLLSADQRTTGIVIEISDTNGSPRPGVVDRIRRIAASAESAAGVSTHLTGIAVQKHDVSRYIARDQAVLIPLSVLALAAALALFFRQLYAVVLPLAVTAISTATTIGIYALCGLELNAITSLLPPLIMVLSLAVSIHLCHGWSVTPQPADRERIRIVVRRLWAPCLLCALTTALAMLSLATSDTPAVRQFGIFAALGVSTSFVVGITLVPVGLTFVRTHPDATHHRWLARILRRLAPVPGRAPRAVFLGFAGVTAIALAALPHLRNNTDLVRFLHEDAPLYRDTMFIDRELTGTNALELMITSSERPLDRVADYQRLQRLEEELRGMPLVTHVQSILPILRRLHGIENAPTRSPLPSRPAELDRLLDLLEVAEQRALIERFLSPDGKAARFTIRLHAAGTARVVPLRRRIQDAAAEILPPGQTAQLTGEYDHVVRDSNRLVREQVKSFSLALLSVLVVIGVVFRSPRATLVAIAPNVLPVLWVGGLMAALAIDLSTGTAMIASAVIGLAVDDTIHYLTAYHRHRRHGSATRAVARSTTGVGSSLSITSMVLVIGFWIGAFGSFKPTMYFSLLTGVTMIGALLCDLLLLPALLVLLDRDPPARAARHPRAAVLLFLLLAVPAIARAAGPVSPRTAQQTRTPEELLARTYVPSEARRVGEVRLLHRGDAEIVRTLLYSKILGRVVGEIREKELRNWPPEEPGHAEAKRYLEALGTARDRAWENVRGRGRHEDRRQKVLIDFVVDPDGERVVVARFEMDESVDPPRITEYETVTTLDLSADYVRRNMRLIVADSFGVPVEKTGDIAPFEVLQ